MKTQSIVSGDYQMVSIDDIKQARDRIKEYIKMTPLRASPFLSKLTGASVFLKLESEQVTGSFKVRGALNRLMTLSKEDAEKGVITASTGNHGLGVAFAAQKLGVRAKVVFPIGASVVKRARMIESAVEVIQDVGYEDIEPYARKLAEERGFTYVSPYNDPEIVAGAGTSGLEIIEQLDAIDAVLVPIGGGGLISGIATVIKAMKPETQVIGVQSEVSPEVHDSWVAGHWVDAEESDSLAQGLMGGVESDSITLSIINDHVDRIILVSEDSIKRAMRFLYEQESLLIEGAGAVTTAALMENKSEFVGKKVVLTLSGGNISKDDLLSQIS
ncbi:threonine/serine dehydratase [Candidatus Thorarchaeota archaeon]|nr:MAG: threonine/serine dehydratase [Candidatus Thorarchaeota archaeon]